jgi:hypothetical protein
MQGVGSGVISGIGVPGGSNGSSSHGSGVGASGQISVGAKAPPQDRPSGAKAPL